MSKYSNLIEFFNKNLSNITFDKELATRLRLYKYGWINKLDDNGLFLGSNLTGVFNPMYTASDVRSFFNDVLFEERDTLQQEVYKVRGIDKSREHSSNIFNITIMWLIRGFLNANDQEAARDAYLLFAYRTFVSIHCRYFKYNVSREIAESVVLHMSNKFLVKKLGSWNDVFIYRANDFIDRKGLNYPRIMKFKTEDVVRSINDGNGRLKSALLQVYALTVEVANKGTKVEISSNNKIDEEGDVSVKDITTGLNSQVDDIFAILADKAHAVDLVYIRTVIKIVKGASRENDLRKMINWLADNIHSSKSTEVDLRELVKSSMSITLDYIQKKGYTVINSSNVINVTIDVKNLWSIRRIEHNQQEIKEQWIELIRKVTNKKSKAFLNSMAVATVTYLFLKMTYK